MADTSALTKRLTQRPTEALQRVYASEMSSGGMLPAIAHAYVLELSHRLQSWRPDSMTLEFADDMPARGLPFCPTCADWHAVTDECSSVVSQ